MQNSRTSSVVKGDLATLSGVFPTRRQFKPLLTAAGIPPEGFSLYSLRHTCASLRLANGENIRVVAEILGTSVTMVNLTYSHVPRKLQQSATDRIAAILYGT